MSRLTEHQIQAINRFPDQNPNPVLRISRDGVLTYANPASAPVRAALGGIDVGDPLPPADLADFRAAALDPATPAVERTHDHRTWALLPVYVEDLDFINLYGTDVTARKAIDKFPDQNPNPVFRLTADGRLLYANAASTTIVAALGVEVGERLPAEWAERLLPAGADESDDQVEIRAGRNTYALKSVPIPEFGFVNVYGTDITGRVAVDKFPAQNPHPVMRMRPDGTLIYANAASGQLVRERGLVVGQGLPAELLAELRASLAAGSLSAVEVLAGDRTYEVLPVPVAEFDFINLYGTDVTAARQLAAAHAENERLLLNILPRDIATRLLRGEKVIADRYDEVTLMFADIVGFTPLASRLAPDEVIELLNGVFSVTDQLAEDYGLEKIKTVGDSFMAAAGLPNLVPDHVERVANMSLALLEAMEHHNLAARYPISCRIGIHVGPAVAGVIGHRKFVYDVWGDTVNLASRMESHGL
ncbi:MAG TPA: adenylate/guanylate cyclase domain-containing protein, partial [Candidatus Limnocylindria bacterium]|nr:adenylate/guanylate cyclase domain-containing protein [Candidatus Limnocylindria bacterium]